MKNNMKYFSRKTILVLLVNTILLFGLMYAFGVFVSLEEDIIKWSQDGRIVFLFLSCSFSITINIVYVLIKHNKRN